MNQEDLKERTKKFAIGIIHFIEDLPKEFVMGIIARQLVRCGTSVGANYRSACRAKSKPDFISKMGIVEEEADEVMYWLELLPKARIKNDEWECLYKEADQLVAIAVASIKTSRSS
ncbi:MAG: four helix bundle protein [Candidatus Omnitrophica bacterium]|nr:four helix bundle protein [Candidatus Omnitrophota bacterium]